MSEERLQKILARAGYASRRASEELIIAGRVLVNGKVAELGSKADPQRDTIMVDNQPIAKQQAPVYIAVNKPQGILSEVSPEEPRQTVRDLVPVPGHLFIVGRLDMESEGLILLTNDGDLANKLSHPRYGHEKEYSVLVGARPDSRQLDAWKHGVVLEDGYRTAPAQVRIDSIAGKGAWLQVILREGRKRQIREMGKQTGLPVLRILRIRIGSLLLGDLKPGAWRELHPDEIRALKVNKTYRESGRGTSRAPRRNGPGSRPGERSGGKPKGPAGGKAGDSSADAPRDSSRKSRAGTPRQDTPARREAPFRRDKTPKRDESGQGEGSPRRGGTPRPSRGAPRRNPRDRS